MGGGLWVVGRGLRKAGRAKREIDLREPAEAGSRFRYVDAPPSTHSCQ